MNVNRFTSIHKVMHIYIKKETCYQIDPYKLKNQKNHHTL